MEDRIKIKFLQGIFNYHLDISNYLCMALLYSQINHIRRPLLYKTLLCFYLGKRMELLKLTVGPYLQNIVLHFLVAWSNSIILSLEKRNDKEK